MEALLLTLQGAEEPGKEQKHRELVSLKHTGSGVEQDPSTPPPAGVLQAGEREGNLAGEQVLPEHRG